MTDRKKAYRELCAREPSIPLFSRDWWLDAVAGDYHWDVVVVESGGMIVASLPYVSRRRFFLDTISMPLFTPNLGIWLKYPEGQKYSQRLAFEKRVYGELIESLPPFDRFHQRFHTDFTNWLPLYWKGFRQTTRYTYVINDLGDTGRIFDNFQTSVRTDIRKAESLVIVSIDPGISALIDLMKMTFRTKGLRLKGWEDAVRKIHQACTEMNCGKVFIARDTDGRAHSGLFLVWDDNSAYYLMSGADPELRSSGAGSLTLWKSIQFAASVTKRFDFEGSMIEPIERFFRAFGGTQVPYFSIYKDNRLVLKIVDAIK